VNQSVVKLMGLSRLLSRVHRSTDTIIIPVELCGSNAARTVAVQLRDQRHVTWRSSSQPAHAVRADTDAISLAQAM
jgi:hypothetical protein